MLDQLDDELKRTATASLHLDIMMSSGVGGTRQHVLLERWTILHGDSAGGANSGGGLVALDGAATSAMHDRLVLLVRNLRAQLRQLPAAVIFRSAAASQFPDQTPRAIYYVVHPIVAAGSGGGSGAADSASAAATASSGGQAPAMAAWESPPHLHSFAQVQTSVGRLRVSVEFRRDVESLVCSREQCCWPDLLCNFLVVFLTF